MTTVIILMYGAGAILVISAVSKDANGNSPSIIATLMEIWNGTPDQSQSGNGGATSPIPPRGKGTGVPNYAAQHWLQQRYGLGA